jgi:glycosyltransferase involved in cell wall biosynthesis
MDNDYIFLVTSYNCRPYIDACITSMLIQEDKDFGIIFVDDASTDGTVDRIKEISRDIHNDHVIHVNEERTGSAAWNQYQAVKKYVTNPNSKICILDGDDELYNEESFSIIKSSESFSPKTFEAGVLGFQSIIPSRSLYQSMYRTSDPYHMRYFKAWLYKAVPESMYYRDGELIKAASDIAFIYPVIQLLNHNFGMTNFVVYKWKNNLTEHNDHFLRLTEQRDNSNYIQGREIMTPLTEEQIQDIKDNWNS